MLTRPVQLPRCYSGAFKSEWTGRNTYLNRLPGIRLRRDGHRNDPADALAEHDLVGLRLADHLLDLLHGHRALLEALRVLDDELRPDGRRLGDARCAGDRRAHRAAGARHVPGHLSDLRHFGAGLPLLIHRDLLQLHLPHGVRRIGQRGLQLARLYLGERHAARRRHRSRGRLHQRCDVLLPADAGRLLHLNARSERGEDLRLLLLRRLRHLLALLLLCRLLDVRLRLAEHLPLHQQHLRVRHGHRHRPRNLLLRTDLFHEMGALLRTGAGHLDRGHRGDVRHNSRARTDARHRRNGDLLPSGLLKLNGLADVRSARHDSALDQLAGIHNAHLAPDGVQDCAPLRRVQDLELLPRSVLAENLELRLLIERLPSGRNRADRDTFRHDLLVSAHRQPQLAGLKLALVDVLSSQAAHRYDRWALSAGSLTEDHFLQAWRGHYALASQRGR